MPVHGQLSTLRLILEDRGWSLRPHPRREGLGDDARGRGLAVHVERSGDIKRVTKVRLSSIGLYLPGEGSPHVLLAGEGPGQLLGGAREIASGVFLLLKVGERGSLAVVFAVPVEGAVPLSVGMVSSGLADGAPVHPQHGAAHQSGGVLHGVALVLNLGLAVRETELAVVYFHGGRIFEDAESTNEILRA